jgi:hypothetical protein
VTALERWRKALAKLTPAQRRKRKRLWRIDWNGCAPVRGWKLKRVVRYALRHYNVYVTSTTGGSHSPTSYHYSGRAVDIGADSQVEKNRCHAGLLKRFGAPYFTELFGPNNKQFVKNGVRYSIADGDPLETQHDNHIHVAI